MNLFDKLEELICDLEGLSEILSLAGASVNDNAASTALIYAGRAVQKLQESAEDIEDTVHKLKSAMQGVYADE